MARGADGVGPAQRMVSGATFDYETGRMRELSSALRRIGDADLTTPVRQALGSRIASLLGRESRPTEPGRSNATVASVVAAGALATLALGLLGAGELWSALGRCTT